jgi:hypothetical protein
MKDYQFSLTTAGGRIQCLRCMAKSSRTQLQCRRPALKTSKTQKCSSHGGRSTGPKTDEGKARIAAAHYIHGEATKAARAEHSHSSVRLTQLEEALHVLGAATGTRTRGRKPNGYKPIQTVADVHRMVVEDLLRSASGLLEAV